MRIKFVRPALVTAAVVASAGILAGGLALRPAFAVGGSVNVGPFAIVHCTSASPCQIYNNGGKGAGLQGINSNGSAPFGSGLTGTAKEYGNGVDGQANFGTGVNGTSTGGSGVAGSSSSYFGTYGYSTNWYGAEGQSVYAHGVEAYSSYSTGLEAASGSGVPISAISESTYPAIEAFGSSGEGLYVDSTGTGGQWGAEIKGSYIGVLARAPDCNTGGFPIVATDQNNDDLMFVSCDGEVFAHSGYGTFARTRDGGEATAYTSKVASPTIEDTGTGHLVNGLAMVQLDPAFARTIDSSHVYHVMLTPDGDTRGLFVASKSPTGFVVREVQGGRSSIDFDYHIYASELGQSGVRMTVLTKGQAAAMGPRATSPLHPVRPTIHVLPHH